MTKLKVLELFGGIGACSKALERLGIDYEIADYVEIDKYAVKSFNAIHNTNFEPQDITQWNKDIEVDLVMHGSPCQDFSLAGLQAGGDKDSGTRSSLMYETIRIVEKLKPKYVIWENVKNLLSKKHRHNFDVYLEIMENLGYQNYYQVLNAKDYGIPQNRERVFTVSILKDVFVYSLPDNYKFIFPPKQELKLKLKDMLEEKVDEKYYLSESNIKTINRNLGSKGEILNLDEFSLIEKMTYPSRINQKINEIICPTLTSAMGTGGGNAPVVNQKNDRLRKLTPKECWRLMGFSDGDFEKAEQVNSNTQLYKQAGNSIVVNVLEAILKNLLTDYIKSKRTLEDLLKGL